MGAIPSIFDSTALRKLRLFSRSENNSGIIYYFPLCLQSFEEKGQGAEGARAAFLCFDVNGALIQWGIPARSVME